MSRDMRLLYFLLKNKYGTVYGWFDTNRFDHSLFDFDLESHLFLSSNMVIITRCPYQNSNLIGTFFDLFLYGNLACTCVDHDLFVSGKLSVR